jgi:hypothetical protein
MKENEKRLNLFSELKLIESAGIGFDKERLKKDISAQFQNTYAWAREYCANAYDAMASTCEFYGVEDEDTISIFVEDNGMGMSLDTLISFFTLYKSTKHGKRENPVGKFGIGKVSVAAIPGQIQFLVRTSDGKSCYEAHAGSLLSDEKIKIYSVPGTFKTGTKFQITFKKTEKVETTLNNITGVLIKYCKYLPLNVLVYPVQKKVHLEKKENRHLSVRSGRRILSHLVFLIPQTFQEMIFRLFWPSVRTCPMTYTKTAFLLRIGLTY